VTIATQGPLSLMLVCSGSSTGLIWGSSQALNWYTGDQLRTSALGYTIGTTSSVMAPLSADPSFSVASAETGDVMVLDVDSTFLGHDNPDYGLTCFATGSVALGHGDLPEPP
jgi:hypothetical protein